MTRTVVVMTPSSSCETISLSVSYCCLFSSWVTVALETAPVLRIPLFLLLLLYMMLFVLPSDKPSFCLGWGSANLIIHLFSKIKVDLRMAKPILLLHMFNILEMWGAEGCAVLWERNQCCRWSYTCWASQWSELNVLCLSKGEMSVTVHLGWLSNCLILLGWGPDLCWILVLNNGAFLSVVPVQVCSTLLFPQYLF